MHRYLIDLLQCPACSGELVWSLHESLGEHVESGQARCLSCSAIYPIREGIAVFLTPDLPREDLWEEASSGLQQYLQENPQLERGLMENPLDSLSPADLFYRGVVLEERGAFAQAKAIFDLIEPRLYTPEYLICHESQVHYLVDYLQRSQEPVVDLASGRGELVQELAVHLTRPLVATDFSLRILRRDRQWFEFFGLHDRISLLAFDARRTPFKEGAVQTLTTNLGLSNIREPGSLLKELRRAVAGEFLAISAFYPEDDLANAPAIAGADLADFLYLRRARKHFAAAGWRLAPANVCAGWAAPTPRGELLEGAVIDTLPAAGTTLEWCTLIAR